MAVLIPAYNPRPALYGLRGELRRVGKLSAILIVDDGSEGCPAVVRCLGRLPGVTLLRHAVNLGKGAAMKTGLNHFCCTLPQACGVVTADADGQHLAADVIEVARRLQDAPDGLILGTRQFPASAAAQPPGQPHYQIRFLGLGGRKAGGHAKRPARHSRAGPAVAPLEEFRLRVRARHAYSLQAIGRADTDLPHRNRLPRRQPLVAFQPDPRFAQDILRLLCGSWRPRWSRRRWIIWFSFWFTPDRPISS